MMNMLFRRHAYDLILFNLLLLILNVATSSIIACCKSAFFAMVRCGHRDHGHGGGWARGAAISTHCSCCCHDQHAVGELALIRYLYSGCYYYPE